MLQLATLTPADRACRLEQLYRLDLAGLPTADPVQAEVVIRWLDACPELLEAACHCWSAGMTEAERDQRGHWLDCWVLGGDCGVLSISMEAALAAASCWWSIGVSG